MITHSVILDTTNALLYPVATPGLLDAKYNRFLIPTDTSAPPKFAEATKSQLVLGFCFPYYPFLKLLHFPHPLIPTHHSPRGLMTKTTTRTYD